MPALRPGLLLPSGLLLLAALLLAACGDRDTAGEEQAAAAPPTVVVYSARNEQLIGPMLQRYTELTGTPTELVTASAGPLLERLKAEGENTPADLLVTVDAGNLWQAAEAGLLQPLNSQALNAAIPEYLRDPQGRWYGLSVRARTLVHHTQRAPAASLSGYAALAEPAWAGRLCLRTSRKVYNQSLVAMLIAERGEGPTESIVRGWVENLAAPPFPNDTAVMEAIQAGLCDVGIVNSYYFGRLQRDAQDATLALHWPSEAVGGVHVNVSGAGVVKHADQAVAARNLLEWLASPQAQRKFAGDNLEYPANPAVEAVPQVAAWGAYTPNLINVSEAGRLQADAVKLMDRAGYR